VHKKWGSGPDIEIVICGLVALVPRAGKGGVGDVQKCWEGADSLSWLLWGCEKFSPLASWRSGLV